MYIYLHVYTLNFAAVVLHICYSLPLCCYLPMRVSRGINPNYIEYISYNTSTIATLVDAQQLGLLLLLCRCIFASLETDLVPWHSQEYQMSKYNVHVIQ